LPRAATSQPEKPGDHALIKRLTTYDQGGDAKAIKAVADAYYGGYRNMFEAHDWPERGEKILPSVQRRVAEAYGSVSSFQNLHTPSDLMFPMEAIKSDPPNVWLTSFYGFNPEGWGFLGFADEGRRRSFLERSRPGVLVVIYGAGKAAKDLLGNVIGVVQCSHETGTAEQFMSAERWHEKERDPERKGKWNFAVKVVRAWRIAPESRVAVRRFAPVATSMNAWQHIGSQGEPLTPAEALNILQLDLQVCDVFGGLPIYGAAVGPAKSILAPSKAGPTSQTPHLVQEAEGPKHLYILRLVGDTDAFLGKVANGQLIIKAGFSKSPRTRMNDHNRALPACAFHWEVFFSGPQENWQPHPTSNHARAGERAMQKELLATGRSLGGEFFLADSGTIQKAWEVGNAAARNLSE
jgi:hypothetical protein